MPNKLLPFAHVTAADYCFRVGNHVVMQKSDDDSNDEAKTNCNGEATPNTIMLRGMEIGNPHCTFDSLADKQVFMEPSQGHDTFVNGEILQLRRILSHGDRVAIGSHLFVFHLPDVRHCY